MDSGNKWDATMTFTSPELSTAVLDLYEYRVYQKLVHLSHV